MTHANSSTTQLRVPPHSIHIEQAVLASLMSIADTFDKITDIIDESSFYAPRHRLIFKAISHLASANMPYDAVMVLDWLTAQKLLASAGSEAYLSQLLDESPSTLFNISTYAEQLKASGARRELIKVSNDIAAAAHDERNATADILASAESSIYSIAAAMQSDKTKSDTKSVIDVLRSTVLNIEALQNNPDALTGITTGYYELDRLTMGMQRSDLIIVAARPSMGKTTFAMNLIESVIFQGNLPALVFSMEMPADSIMLRLLSSHASISHGNLRSGRLQESDWVRLTSTMAQLQTKHLYIDDGSALSPTELRSRARRIAKMHGGLGCIMVDYLQLMKIQSMGDNRVGEISEISRSLKALAKEMNCPVIALSQLNRSLENRPNKRPMMSDLRDSGAIEQDADVIMFIYRDDVYNKESKDAGTAEIIIGKQRNGPIGTVRLAFEGNLSRFTNLVTHGEA